jgi:CubicO group peptidase (beta-lactamase class C family)
MPQSAFQNPVFNAVAPMVAALPLSAGFGSMYFPGVKAVAQGDIPLLDAEIPAANGVATARGLARMYGAIANGGRIDGTQFLSRELAAGLSGRRSLRPDGNLLIPLAFHLGYHRLPFDVIPGFGHVGLGGSLGWADPDGGLAFGFVHNRLLSPFVVVDHAGFVATGALARRGAAEARKHGFERVAHFGSPLPEPGAVAG